MKESLDPRDAPELEAPAANTLAREVPGRASLIKPTRYNFGQAGMDRLDGPLGPGSVDPNEIFALLPPAKPILNGTASANSGAGINPIVIPVKQPTIILTLTWDMANAAAGLHRMLYKPVIPPVATGELAYLTGHGGIAYLSQPGDWYVAWVTSGAHTVRYLQWEVCNPEHAAAILRDVQGMPTEHVTTNDVVLGAAASAELYRDVGDVLTAVNVKNIGANPVRVVANTPAAAGGSQGIYLNPVNVAGSEYEFRGPSLPRGDIWGFSTLGSTVVVNAFTKDYTALA